MSYVLDAHRCDNSPHDARENIFAAMLYRIRQYFDDGYEARIYEQMFCSGRILGRVHDVYCAHRVSDTAGPRLHELPEDRERSGMKKLERYAGRLIHTPKGASRHHGYYQNTTCRTPDQF